MVSKIVSFIIIPLLITVIGLFGKFFMTLIKNLRSGSELNKAIDDAKQEGIIFSSEVCLIALGADIGLKHMYSGDPTLMDIFFVVILAHIGLWLFTIILTIVCTKTKYRIHLNNAIGAFTLSSVIIPLLVWG